MRYQGTNIDGPTVNPDRLMVRGTDLCDLIGTSDYLEALFFTLYGQLPLPAQYGELQRYFTAAFASIAGEDALFEVISQVATQPAFSLNGLIAGLTIDRQAQITDLAPPDFGDIALSPLVRDGFYFLAILPIVAGVAAEYPVSPDLLALRQRLAAAQALQGEYLDKMAFFLRGQELGGAPQRRLLNAVLVAFCAGFGFMTPSIMAPRISIGSGVSVGLAIIAGCTTGGAWHLGTSQYVMEMLQEILQDIPDGNMPAAVERYVGQKLTSGQKLLGFGHPFFKRDPRVLRLAELVNEVGVAHPALSLMHQLTHTIVEAKDIYPNLETAHGAILLALGFSNSFHGPCLALFGRVGGMIAHMEERMDKPKFGVRNEVARNFFDKVPMEWL